MLRVLDRPASTSMPMIDLDFKLPPSLEASEPPEARGLTRDDVRLMVSYLEHDRIIHTRFRYIVDYLKPGDVLVINTSGTMNAAVPATRSGDARYELHLSTRLPADQWIVEMRRTEGGASQPFYDANPGEVYDLPDGGSVTLLTPYHSAARRGELPRRLWIAVLDMPCDLNGYLEQHGLPIRYSYVREEWPLSYYQTVYATETGSAEMPSAGRAFTPELLTKLVAKGVQIAPLLLHTGVSSPENHEPPYEEFYRVPPQTAQIVNTARASGGRIIAVGTTAVRALETVTTADGVTYPGSGYTDLIITPARGLKAVDAMLTGLHEPQATHLDMMEALAGRDHLKLTYAEALDEGYLWHEFGDLHLILP